MPSIYSIHGNAVTVAERPGGGAIGSPGDLEQVSGVAWSDVVGLRQGWGTTFRGKSGKFVWFHVPFPTPVTVNGIASDVERLEVLFDVASGVVVDSIHLWDNAYNRWFARDRLGLTSSFVSGFDRGTILRGALSISVGVSFRSAANITFRGAILAVR